MRMGGWRLDWARGGKLSCSCCVFMSETELDLDRAALSRLGFSPLKLAPQYTSTRTSLTGLVCSINQDDCH